VLRVPDAVATIQEKMKKLEADFNATEDLAMSTNLRDLRMVQLGGFIRLNQ
jgi:hypothetical protein